MKKILALTVVLMLVLSSSAFAHEISILLNPDGQVGEEHVINVNWGDFGQFLDPRSSYFDTIMNGELWVLTPDGQRIELQMEELPDRYVARFTPQIAGQYQVIFYHNRGVINQQHGEPQGLMNIEVISKSFVDVEGDDEIDMWDQVVGLPLEIKALTDVIHLHTGGEVKGQLLFFGEPLAGINLTVYSPNGTYDAPMRLTTGQDGQFSFIAGEEGAWLIKLAYFDDSVEEVDGEEVIGALYNFTMTVFPHGEDEEFVAPTQPINTAGSNTMHILYMLSVVLTAGASYMFGKGRSS